MGIVKLHNTGYYTNKLSEAEYIDAMIQYEHILEKTLMKMYKATRKSDRLPPTNVEGCIETIIMRSVHNAMSRVRHEMKHKIKIIEE